MWENIKIISVEAFRTHHKSKHKDKTRVTLEMPTKDYSKFRRHVETSHMRNRRKDDDRENNS